MGITGIHLKKFGVFLKSKREFINPINIKNKNY